ncbi:DUF962 domain-containing protein [bacterium]|nr:DUF962 domain-containing protein [bacterium]
METTFASFHDFYPYYLSEHSNSTCRKFHFFGTTLVLLTLVYVIITHQWILLWLMPIFGYGFAWAGHFFFEKNRPATFKYPFYSLAGDFVMYKDIWTGKVKF